MDEFLTEKKTGYSEDAEFSHCEIGLSFRLVISVELTLEVKSHGLRKKNVVCIDKERCRHMLQTAKERCQQEKERCQREK